MSERWERVAHLLLPCADHTKDADWMPNAAKQFCDRPGCRVPLCTRCAYNGELRRNGVLYGYCEKHAKESA